MTVYRASNYQESKTTISAVAWTLSKTQLDYKRSQKCCDFEFLYQFMWRFLSFFLFYDIITHFLNVVYSNI